MRNYLKLLMLLVGGLIGAALYRFRGMSSKYKKYLPRPFNQMLFALPFALYTYYNCYTFQIFGINVYPWEEAAIVWVLTTLAILTGHGGWMDLAHFTKKRSDERLEFLIKWLKPLIPEYWYDVLGIALNGFFITLPTALFTLNPLIAFIGLSKAPAYMIGWAVYPKGKGKGPKHLNEATGLGEALTGWLFYLLLASVWVFQ